MTSSSRNDLVQGCLKMGGLPIEWPLKVGRNDENINMILLWCLNFGHTHDVFTSFLRWLYESNWWNKGFNWMIWDVFCFHGMKAVLKPPAPYDSVGLRPWAPPGALGTLPASSCRSCSACWRNWTKTLWPKMLRWGRRGIPRWETHVFFWWIFRRFCKHAGLQPRKLMKCIFSISW